MSHEEQTELESIDVPDKLFFRIGETAQLVGVEPHVLRYWESEFRLRPHPLQDVWPAHVSSARTSPASCASVACSTTQGFTIAGARKALAGQGSRGGQDAGRRTTRVGSRRRLDRIESAAQPHRVDARALPNAFASRQPTDARCCASGGAVRSRRSYRVSHARVVLPGRSAVW